MSWACAALSDLDFSSDVSCSSEENEKFKREPNDFTGLCLKGKSSRHISNSDSNVSDDLSPDGLSLRVVEVENALCNQDNLLYKIFVKTKGWILSLRVLFLEIASLWSAHNDMSAKPCDNCNMIMVNYVGLWLINSHVASQLDSAKLELRELKTHSTLLDACTSCSLLRSNLEVLPIEIKHRKHKLDHSWGLGFKLQTLCLFIVNGLIKVVIEKPSGQFLGLIVLSHWLAEVWIQIRDNFDGFTFIFVLFGESCLLVSCCAGGRCGMVSSDEKRGRSMRPSAEDWGWSHRSGTQWLDDGEIGWRRMRSAPCTRRWW
jgi:hypothetical protein